MSQFYKLTVSDIKRETKDAVSVAFDVPFELKSTFAYVAGQYLTLKFNLEGRDERRAYSLCSAPSSNEYRVAVKEVENGKVSAYINNTLKVGDVIEVMPPQGNFKLETASQNNKIYVGIAAGSGITPVIAMAKEVLINEPGSRFLLIYGNRSGSETIFKAEIDQLSGVKFDVKYLFSRENVGSTINQGRLSAEKIKELAQIDKGVFEGDAYYLCGPEAMIVNVSEGLRSLGVSKDKIHFELFTTPVSSESTKVVNEFSGMAKVKVIYDEEEVEFDLHANGDSILDAAMGHDVDVPFSCKGAVCCTCKAKVTEGAMVMDANYSLSEEEVAQGYILTCQAHPASPYVVVDFDEA